jgi:hypothetical protein
MVNTFLTRPLERDEHPEEEFYKSAQLLDNKRLPNQVREALWIYNMLQDLQTVVTTLKWDEPPPILPMTATYQERAERFFERRQWYENTLTRYHQCDFTVIVKNGVTRAVPENQAMDYISTPTRPERSKLHHGVKYYWVGKSGEEGKWVSREHLFILDRGERIITLKNYPKHPINFM